MKKVLTAAVLSAIYGLGEYTGRNELGMAEVMLYPFYSDSPATPEWDNLPDYRR